MKKLKLFFKTGFYFANIVLMIFYLYPGSILGWFLYNDFSIQPQITEDFIISSNHFFAFTILSILGVISYQNTNKINFIIKYLFTLSILLEFFHIIIPNRSFEFSDLFGNIMGVVVVVIVNKVIKKNE